MRKLLAFNRGEIAIRILRAAAELGLRTVAVYSQEDRLSLHRFKADEAYLIGAGQGPVQAYLDVEGIVAMAAEKGVDAIKDLVETLETEFNAAAEQHQEMTRGTYESAA